MKFRPLHDRVVVERIDRRSEVRRWHHHSRHRPGEAARRARSLPSDRAAATRAGKLIPIDLKVGDRVLFGKWSGTEVKIEGQELLIMKEIRHHGRAPGNDGQEEGRLSYFHHRTEIRGVAKCLPRKLNSQLMRATGCCAASTFWPMRFA